MRTDEQDENGVRQRQNFYLKTAQKKNGNVALESPLSLRYGGAACVG